MHGLLTIAYFPGLQVKEKSLQFQQANQKPEYQAQCRR